ncbi:uncharacterized protein Dana_GF15978 [Drosophila ananassae]|uniref:Uncharacterized protein n=1 Tax=Drosophila ananassae TaxID=7217 RepID=B3N101_DROAN|nr:uncharacterized protein LOC6498779 [Drosophila ananassae]EDV30036.1 uncharacterized protein Dana_GF15978 [Drosophila ananassae]
MQRTAFKAACYRVLSKMNLQQQQREYHHTTLQVQELQDCGAGSTAAARTTDTASAVEPNRSRSFLSSLDLLGRLFHGRLYLLGGRPVPPRFLRLLIGDRTLSFSSDEDEEFRQRLGMQLKELRDVLHGNEETDDLDQPDESRYMEGEEAAAGPYASASTEAWGEDLTEEDKEDIRTVRMTQRGEGGDADIGDELRETAEKQEFVEPEAELDEEDALRSEVEETSDPHHQMRDGEVDGVYWTGEGERIVTINREKPRVGPSGYISGEGEEVPAVEDRPMPDTRSQAQEQNLPSEADSDE